VEELALGRSVRTKQDGTQTADVGPRASILLVDDTAANLLALGAVLAPLEQRLVEARCGEEALRHLLHEDFAVILIDVAMPGMDGYEAAQFIRGRDRSRQTPIIFVTAHQPSPEQVTRAYALGAVDFLVKPLVPVVLRAKVSVFVELYLRAEQVKRQQELLRQQQQQVLRAEQLAAVGRLATGIAHEVRNPLTAIKLLVEGALRPHAPRPLNREQLTVLHGEIVRLEHTVQEFLDFARPPKLCRRTADLREVVEQAASLVRPRAQRQGVHLQTHVPGQPVPAEVDPGQFGAVLVNLFLNALDAQPGGGAVEVNWEPRPGEVRLAVSDSGPGIRPDILAQLFTPFFSSKPTGTGLGLCISRRVVEEHGGRIAVVNRQEGGVSVRIVLPASSAPSPEVDHAEPAADR
jgi:signal transduction histidine kinase